MVLCQRRVKQVDGYDGEGGGRKTTRKNWEGRGGRGGGEGKRVEREEEVEKDRSQGR